jgi:hypothetical protein
MFFSDHSEKFSMISVMNTVTVNYGVRLVSITFNSGLEEISLSSFKILEM